MFVPHAVVFKGILLLKFHQHVDRDVTFKLSSSQKFVQNHTRKLTKSSFLKFYYEAFLVSSSSQLQILHFYFVKNFLNY